MRTVHLCKLVKNFKLYFAAYHDKRVRRRNNIMNIMGMEGSAAFLI